MELNFYTPIIRELEWDDGTGTYKMDEVIESTDKKLTATFNLFLSAKVVEDRGDYFTPPSYGFKDEVIDISNLRLWNDDGEIELTPELHKELEQTLLDCIAWEQ